MQAACLQKPQRRLLQQQNGTRREDTKMIQERSLMLSGVHANIDSHSPSFLLRLEIASIEPVPP
jgi:hypothetical protein